MLDVHSIDTTKGLPLIALKHIALLIKYFFLLTALIF